MSAPGGTPSGIAVRPILGADLAVVGAFLSEHLDGRLTPLTWERALVPTWPTDQDDHGYVLEDGGRVVGVYAAFHAVRPIAGVERHTCNLAAWCVLDEYRAHGLRLVRAMLAQRDVLFTDLSPSGSVVPLNERLGFAHLDTSGALVVNLGAHRARRARVLADGASIRATLDGDQRRIYADHEAALAARHVVLVAGERTCYVVWRRVRRKRLPFFATVLYVSDRALFAEVGGSFFRHLLARHGIWFTLVERRIVGSLPPRSMELRSPRPKMVRAPGGACDVTDDLYSELACVPW